MNKNDEEESAFPTLFLLLENPKKSNNLGPILRCASAFGIQTVVAVGYEKCAVEGSHGASKHIQIVAFPTAGQAVDYLRTEQKCETIVGLLGSLANGYEPKEVVCDTQLELARILSRDPSNSRAGRVPAGKESEADPKQPTFLPVETDLLTHLSSPVHMRPFSSQDNTCIVLSKERRGLPLGLAKYCTQFIHVPHFAMENTGLVLDCPSCLSIALHEYTEHIGYSERNFKGHKFDVARRQHSASHAENKRAKRMKEREDEHAEAEAGEDRVLGTILFGGTANDGDY